MEQPRITLEQWRVLQAVVDYGGYAQAAEKLHRSQSAISYNLSKMQEQLGIALLRIEGRKAQLTEAGSLLLRRSRGVLNEARLLEELASNLEQGWEAEIHLVVDSAFPNDLLFSALKSFAPHDRGTRIQLDEVILSGAEEALASGRTDLIISALMSGNILADSLLSTDFIAVAHPQHSLHHLGRKISMTDLQHETQVVIKDSGESRSRNVGWLGAEHRWTVTNIDTALTAIMKGLGYGWLPEHYVKEPMALQKLKPLPLEQGQTYHTTLYIAYGKANPGPATQLLSNIIKETVSGYNE